MHEISETTKEAIREGIRRMEKEIIEEKARQERREFKLADMREEVIVGVCEKHPDMIREIWINCKIEVNESDIQSAYEIAKSVMPILFLPTHEERDKEHIGRLLVEELTKDKIGVSIREIHNHPNNCPCEKCQTYRDYYG